MEKSSTKNGGMGFCGALAIAFIVLKLVGVIDWSWIWVLAPIWIPIAILAAITIIVFAVTGIKMLIEK